MSSNGIRHRLHIMKITKKLWRPTKPKRIFYTQTSLLLLLSTMNMIMRCRSQNLSMQFNMLIETNPGSLFESTSKSAKLTYLYRKERMRATAGKTKKIYKCFRIHQKIQTRTQLNQYSLYLN
jgi:hypothetical protein